MTVFFKYVVNLNVNKNVIDDTINFMFYTFSECDQNLSLLKQIQHIGRFQIRSIASKTMHSANRSVDILINNKKRKETMFYSFLL